MKVSGAGEEGEGEWERESQGSDKKARNLAQRAVAWRVGGLGASRSLDLSTTNTHTKRVCVCFTCHSSRVEVRGQLGVNSFLPPYGFQRSVASVSTHRALLLADQVILLRKEDNTRTHVKGFECGVRRKRRPAGTWLPVLSHRGRTAVFMDVTSMCWVLACTRSRVQNA